MKTFPGEKRAWVGKDERARGVVGERWHVYFVLDGASRRLERWIEQVQRITLDALPTDADGVLSVVDPAFRHITCHMISLPAEEISAEQIAAFAADLAWRLAGIEPFVLQMRWPVAATGSVEGDVYDPNPHRPWQAVSDLVGSVIVDHFGPEARRYLPPPGHSSIFYGAPHPGGDDALLIDSGIIQSALRRGMREDGVEFRVGELHLLRVRQNPDQSTYTWSQDTAVRIPLGTGLSGSTDGQLWQALGTDPQVAADTEAAGALDGLNADEACAAAALGARGAESRTRLASLVDAGVLGYRAGRYRLLDLPAPEPCDGLDFARERLLSWYLAAAGRALELTGNDSLSQYGPSRAHTGLGPVLARFETGREWFETERENLRALVPGAYAHGQDEQCWRLSALWCGYLATNSDFTPWREAVQTGLRAARRAGSDQGVAMMLEFQGKLWTQSGDYEHGEAAAREALELRERIGDEHGRMRSANALGLTLLRAGDPAQAAACFEKAQARADEHGPVDFRIAARINLAIAYIDMNGHRQAEAVLREAVELADPERHIGYLADGLQRLGTALCALSLLPEALTVGQKAVDAARRSGSQPHVTGTLIALAETLSTAGDHAKALDTARQACAAARRPGDPARIRSVMRRAAAVAARAGHSNAATVLEDQAR